MPADQHFCAAQELIVLRDCEDILPRTMSTSRPSSIKVCMLGPAGVGKTALAVRLTQSGFFDGHDPTANTDMGLMRATVVDEQACVLEIVDPPGDEFSAMYDSYMRTCDGFVCVYSCTSQASFDAMRGCRERAMIIKDKDHVPILFVASKCDMEADRQVASSEGERLAAEHGHPFYETSAKTGVNVEVAFFELVREVWRARMCAGGRGKKKCAAM